MTYRIEGEGPVRINSLETVQTNSAPLQTQQQPNHAGANSVVGEMNQQASMVRLNLTRQVPVTQDTSPSDGIKQINELPVPQYSDTPRNLPPEDRQAILDERLKEYNKKRAEIADNAVQNSQPPKREDFKGLNGATADYEFRQAEAEYNQQMAELKRISAEAKAYPSETPEEAHRLFQLDEDLKKAVPDPTARQAIINSPAWKDHSKRQAILSIAQKASDEGDKALAVICQDPKKFNATDSKGQSLLANLEKLATQELNKKISEDGGGEATRTKILDGVLKEISDPEKYVTQESANTCASTAAQYSLVKDDPSEYVRLMVGLTGKEGKVEMRGGGELGLQHESFENGGIVGDFGRLASGVVFQGAAIEFATGTLVQYNAATDKYDINVPGPTILDGHFSGLTSEWQDKLLSDLYGKEFHTTFGTPSLVPIQMGEFQAGEAYNFLKGYKTGPGTDPVQITYHFPTESGWNIAEVHTVTFDHVDPVTGRVYFRNPWGNYPPKTNNKAGHVDPAHPELFYLTDKEFKDSAVWVVSTSPHPEPAPATPVPGQPTPIGPPPTGQPTPSGPPAIPSPSPGPAPTPPKAS